MHGEDEGVPASLYLEPAKLIHVYVGSRSYRHGIGGPPAITSTVTLAGGSVTWSEARIAAGTGSRGEQQGELITVHNP